MCALSLDSSRGHILQPAHAMIPHAGVFQSIRDRISHFFKKEETIPGLGLPLSYLNPSAPPRTHDFSTGPIVHAERDGGWSTQINAVAGDPFPELSSHAGVQKGPYATREQMIEAEVRLQKSAIEREGIKTSRKELNNSWLGVRNSTIFQPSLEARVQFSQRSDNLLQRDFTTRYLLVQNSPLNGCQFGDQLVEGAVTSSLDRYAPGMSLVRKMELEIDGAKETVCYAGRPDTAEKFEELIKTVFLGGYHAETDGGPGIKKDPETGIYEMVFVMNSFISTAKAGKTEFDLINKEHEELQKLRERVATGETIEVMKDGRVFQVKPKILFYSRQFNFTNRLEQYLPSKLTGELQSELFSDSTEELESCLSDAQRQMPQIQRCLELLKHKKELNLASEEELFLRTLICEIAGLPTIFHCRSCVDRTSIAAAMAYAIKLSLKFGMEIPNPPYLLMDNEAFKELWYANVSLGHMMSAYSREDFGFKWQTGPFPLFTMHPAVLRLMPKRYLAPFTLSSKVTSTFFDLFKQHPKFTPLFALSLPLLFLKTPVSSIKNWCLSPDKSGLEKGAAIFYRSLAAIFLIVLGVLEVALIFSFGSLAAIMYSVQTRDYKQLLLGIRLLQTFFEFIPKETLNPDIQLHGEPLIFSGKTTE